jgi:hypothetical protein
MLIERNGGCSVFHLQGQSVTWEAQSFVFIVEVFVVVVVAVVVVNDVIDSQLDVT